MGSDEPTTNDGIEDAAASAPSLATGIDVIQTHLRTLPNSPGVYRMLSETGDALYVGKARSLKKRVIAYTQPQRLDNRLLRMVSETRAMEFITTHTEAEALLLESNLIKKLRPRFNILLRDDKSFPYILLTGDHDYPQVVKHRGARSRRGEFFGPFASAGAVNRTINALQRAFLLRSCSDNVFANRSRPCLLFQIKRCSGPCVDRISRDDYMALVGEARRFLTGASSRIQAELAEKMQAASDDLDFEKAAMLRDRIRGMSMIQSHQDINSEGVEDADVIAGWEIGGQFCIQVFFFRGGRNNGNRAYFPANTKAQEPADVMSAFIAQFYDNKPPPPLLLLSDPVSEAELLAEALGVKAGRKVRLHRPERGAKRELVAHAVSNAREALERRAALVELGVRAHRLDPAVAEPEAIRARLKTQIAELMSAEPGLPEDRLAQEVALLATKQDVREELDRLVAHVAQARELLADSGPVGRRLDFLTQEFNREANTLCSKAGNVELTRIGLELKAVIDQLREQVQNIE